jgi:hypothetical protein
VALEWVFLQILLVFSCQFSLNQLIQIHYSSYHWFHIVSILTVSLSNQLFGPTFRRMSPPPPSKSVFYIQKSSSNNVSVLCGSIDELQSFLLSCSIFFFISCQLFALVPFGFHYLAKCHSELFWHLVVLKVQFATLAEVQISDSYHQ